MPLKTHNGISFSSHIVKTYDGLEFVTRDAYYYDATDGTWEHVNFALVHTDDGELVETDDGTTKVRID